mmetsp:Transcript_2130/g.5250  ORF Transcript_2130/g.5250 Transcript_2130/m.5250 type:complete len:304 (+) Transcript_2130:101-1012(+)
MPIIKEDKFNKYCPDSFNFDTMKGEVNEAMQFDWKRDKVDDAKKRAIYQATNYDDFKQRVAGCTLKPIHKDEFNAPPKYLFNRHAEEGSARRPLTLTPAANSGAPSTHEVPRVGGGATSSAETRVPRTGHEFERELRRKSGPTEKVRLLERLSSDDYARVFGKELDAEVLRQLLVALDEVRNPGAARNFLTELANRCPSSATVASSFFGHEERALVATLLACDVAAGSAVGSGDDVRICAVFGVPPAVLAAAVSAAAGQRVEEPTVEAPLEGAVAECSSPSHEPCCAEGVLVHCTEGACNEMD